MGVNDKIKTILSQGLYSLNSFIVIFLLARLFSKEIVGDYALINSVILTFIVAPITFVSMPVMSSLIKGPENISESLIIYLLICSVSFPLYFIVFDLFYKYDMFVVLLSFFYMSVLFFYEIVRRFIFISSVSLSIFHELLRLSSTISLLLLSAGAIDLAQVWLVLTAGVASPILHFLYKERKSIFTSIDRRVFKNSFNFGIWIFITNLAQALCSSLYIFITAMILKPEIISGVAVSRSLIGYSTVIILSIDSILSRRFSFIFSNESKEKYRTYFRNQFIKLSTLYFICCVPLLIYSGEILSIVFGDEYSSYSTIFGLLIINSAFVFSYKILSLHFRTVNNTRPILSSTLPGILIVSTLSYFGIVYFGVTGGVLVLLFSQMIGVFILLIYVWKDNAKTTCEIT